jgi:hypothetical protein
MPTAPPPEPTGLDLGADCRPIDLGDVLPDTDDGDNVYTVHDGTVSTMATVSFAQPSLSGLPPTSPPHKLICTGRVRGRAPRLRSNHRRRGSRRAAGIRSSQDPGDDGESDPDLARAGR